MNLQNTDGEDSDDSDDEIKLDGALTRRSDAEEDDEEDEEEEEEDEEEQEGAGRIGAGAAPPGDDEQTVVDVCLDFCDPHERFFHGIRCGIRLLNRVLRPAFSAPRAGFFKKQAIPVAARPPLWSAEHLH